MNEITIDTLKKLWKTDKEFYRTAEIGSGVQKFCKKVFQCSRLFNLKEGTGTTKEVKRKNEFLEEAKKKSRRADVVIFINTEIIVPVEVEKHGNIKAGVKQIYNYQADWVKKYGILTDGNEWRFYNNKYIEKTYFIDNLLEAPTDFLTFWKEYITPEYYYLSFFKKKGQQALEEKDIPHLDDVREEFFKDITKLIENFKNKLGLKGYFKELKDENERNKKAVEITYAYLIQFILYKTLVDNSFSDFENDWKDRIKSIDKALHSESYGEILRRIQGISNKISENIYKRFSDEQEIINNHLKEILDKPKNEIGDVSVWLDILLFINRYNFANVKNEIFGYVYENYLKDLYLDEKKGQYFTDPLIVEFMLDQIGYSSENLKKRYAKDKDSISIIDPSCGSGTFLYNATHRLVDTFFENTEKSSMLVEKLVNENIFGLDIAEFPLYLAEMNILMRMLPLIITEKYNNPVEQKIKMFKTRDSISEFFDTAIRNTLTDVTTEWKKNKGQLSLFTETLDLGYQSHMRDYRDLEPMKRSLENHTRISRYRFDFVIGNPPYVSYNECAKQKLLIIQLIQDSKVNMGDIYGVNLNSIPNKLKSYPPKPNLYAFFIALGVALLKDNGKICYIIPQTILTANDLDVLRYYLSNFVTIEKILTFSGNMFIGRGIKQDKPVPTSSLIFVISKLPPTKLHEIEIINYFQKENVPFDTKDLTNPKKWSKVVKKKILQNNLRQNSDNWNYITLSKEIIAFLHDYERNSESFDVYRLFELSVPRYGEKFYFDVGFILDDKYIKDENNGNCYEILDFKTFKGYSKFYPTLFYPKDNRVIQLTRSNQGHITLQPKYNLVWRIKNSTGFKLTDHPIIFNMGTSSIITTDHKKEAHYLLSLLNSPVSSLVLESYLKIPSEKEYLLAILPIKKYIRIPIINNLNEVIKKEIIQETIRMLELENNCFTDFIDFTGILQQKFDSVEVKGNVLIICYKTNCVKCKITGNAPLVKQMLNENLPALTDENGIGNISDIKNFPVIDFEKQKQIKKYIDDLVFALYFNVKLSSIGFSNREQVHKIVSKHKYYKLINL
ncbi:MAG: N-6 DNA methylase [Bacteroidia bacterium]|nr:N-6 DNA methylase [Bacteroidia bacterium]